MNNTDQYIEYIAMGAVVVSLFIGYLYEKVSEYVLRRIHLNKRRKKARLLFQLKKYDASRKLASEQWYSKLEEIENILRTKGRI